ncbi:MAG: DUF4276 family protein [Armatimonadota bacterium]|nr:DUF4276 family protein [Armatimonadota bacterium]
MEGPSDEKFWNKVLPRSFPGVQFKFQIMNGCPRLIRDAPKVINTFKQLGYASGFLLLDYDTAFRKVDLCPGKVLDRFDPYTKAAASLPLTERFVHVCVAVRGLESWYLVDEAAINKLLPDVSYVSPPETGSQQGKTLDTLWRQQQQGAFNKLSFAPLIGSIYTPQEACKHSQSFARFWERITTVTATANSY